jgi:hypothetical protein
MPKLSIPVRTTGRAIECLVYLYKKEPGFSEQLQEIRSVHEPAVIKWLDSSIPQWRNLQTELIQTRDGQDTQATLSEANIKLLKKFSNSIRRFYEGWNVTSDLINYEKELRDLAYSWHFKSKKSGIILILSHIYDLVGFGMERNEIVIETPVDVIEPLLGRLSLPPLIFKVSAYELMYSDQGEIVQEFVKELSDYRLKLKSIGWKELPSALKIHAFWWFEHYVHGRSYKEISAEQSPELNENSVRQAVFRFRNLLGIEIG